MIPLIPITDHEQGCGSCSMCCKLLHIVELNKPQNVWCRDVIKGKGCGIYADRPQVCKDFECLWLQCGAPPPLRPDRIKGLLTTTTDGKNVVLHEDPGFPGRATAACRDMIQGFIADRTAFVVVICGTKRTFFGDPALFQKAVADANEVVINYAKAT